MTVNSLNVRSSIWGTILGQIPNGRRLVQIGEQDGWVKVWYEGRAAWIYKGYTQRVTSGTADQVTTDVLNVRTGPGTSNSIVGQARNGQQYVRSSSSGDWRQIHFGRNLRWFHGGYTKAVPIR
ncbi:MAG: hypothetical protein HY720_18755 [Planctomycetes bacterium]|nr:hypothetical protein [Planctomycetota bacterium]